LKNHLQMIPPNAAQFFFQKEPVAFKKVSPARGFALLIQFITSTLLTIFKSNN